jgi:putative ABC transport system substrate-binding protein
VRALVQGLTALGYEEGKNLVLEWRSAEARYDNVPIIVREMVATGVDVLVVPIGPIAIAAKDVTKTLPIVVVSVGDPVAIGLVSSLARPEGNLTGLTMNSLEIICTDFANFLTTEALCLMARMPRTSGGAAPASLIGY